MKPTVIFKISTVLWAIWGAFHLILGAGLLYLFSIGGDALNYSMVADDPLFAGLFKTSDPAVRANLINYAWNIGWFGLVTTVGVYFIWKENTNAVFLNAIVGGLADLGYFVFVDIPGFAPPIGQVMTVISASAIILSFYAVFKRSQL